MNADGHKEGVGIITFDNGNISSAEFHNGKRNGVAKNVFNSGNNYWGQVKNDNLEGYG